MEQAATIADENAALVQQVAEKSLGISPGIASVMTVGRFPTNTDSIALQRTADQMFTGGLISKPLKVSTMVLP
jgi:hypothetical protein